MAKIKTPSELNSPAFLMNFPFTVDNAVRNNILMKNHTDHYDYPRAFRQWLKLYKTIVDLGGVVYILPSEKDFQDLPYVANIGCYLPHLEEHTILVSNFYSPPRIGEEIIGVKFFMSMRYETRMCPHFWEGEADLKYLMDNIYASPYGIRTEKASHDWMRSNFNMDIVSIELHDEKLYHLDCVLFPMDDYMAAVATSVLKREDVKELEKRVEVLSIPENRVYNGWTNCIRIGNNILHASDPSNKEIQDFYGRVGFDTIPIELDEFNKSGADLSCLVMHFNHIR